MRVWHKDLIPVLPGYQLIRQWQVSRVILWWTGCWTTRSCTSFYTAGWYLRSWPGEATRITRITSHDGRPGQRPRFRRS